MKREDIFKEIIRSGDILDMIRKDFSRAKVLSKSEYMHWIEGDFREYSNVNFAKVGDHILSVGYRGYLEPQSLANRVTGVDIGDDFYFIVRNMETDEYKYAKTYEKLKEVLRGR